MGRAKMSCTLNKEQYLPSESIGLECMVDTSECAVIPGRLRTEVRQ
jgi:hypothetical protein